MKSLKLKIKSKDVAYSTKLKIDGETIDAPSLEYVIAYLSLIQESIDAEKSFSRAKIKRDVRFVEECINACQSTLDHD